MSEIRCDVCSAPNGIEIPFATGSALIPQADFIRCDVSPAGLWMVTWCWGNDAFMQSLGRQAVGLPVVTLGSKNGNNCHATRWLSSGRFRTFRIYTVDGVVNLGEWIDWNEEGTQEIQRGTFDAIPAGSQGIFDVTPDGWPQFIGELGEVTVDGIRVRNAMTRNGRTTCVSGSDGKLGWGVSVFEAGRWYKVSETQTQLNPRIAENGTVAISGDPGGFYPRVDWLTRPFDPHAGTPPPPPPPPPGDPVESLLPALQTLRAQYGATMSSDQCVELLNRLLWEAPDKGWRLWAKPGGAGGTRYDGVRCSHDFLVHTNGQCADVFGDAGGATSPQWGPKAREGDEKDASREVAPIVPHGHTNPPPPPPPPDDDLLARVEALERADRRLAETLNDSNQAVIALIADLAKQVDELKKRPAGDTSAIEKRLGDLSDKVGRLKARGKVSLGDVWDRKELAWDVKE